MYGYLKVKNALVKSATAQSTPFAVLFNNYSQWHDSYRSVYF
jgi:hypothetical protein